jgi:hypothetical protein
MTPPQFGPSGPSLHFRFKDPISPNWHHITFSRHVSSFSDDMVDFLCSKISSFDVRRNQPTPKSSKVEIGFWLHSNKNSFYLDLYPCLGPVCSVHIRCAARASGLACVSVRCAEVNLWLSQFFHRHSRCCRPPPLLSPNARFSARRIQPILKSSISASGYRMKNLAT